MIRFFDVFFSTLILLFCAPFIIIISLLIITESSGGIIFRQLRVGRYGNDFYIYKFRTMYRDSDKKGLLTIGKRDERVTKTGYFLRKYKLDELPQFLNVLKGDMSIVGPRPEVRKYVDLYTEEQKKVLLLKPGITDFSSIVFSDEGDILKDKADPDIAYNQLIRPWKSKLGIFYIDNRSSLVDLKLIYLTVIAILSRDRALLKISKLLKILNANDELVRVSLRHDILIPTPPPGSSKIVTNREGKVDY